MQRSSSALGECVREWDLNEEGNFVETIYTNQLMVDSKKVIESLINSKPSIKFFNMSDGILIRGALASRISSYSFDDNLSEYQARLDTWLSTLNPSNVDSTLARWQLRNPRKNIYETSNTIKSLLQGPDKFFPDLIDKLSSTMDLSVPMSKQFSRRLMRGTFMKTVIAISQLYNQIWSEDKTKLLQFETLAKDHLLSIINLLELEAYKLCDHVDPGKT